MDALMGLIVAHSPPSWHGQMAIEGVATVLCEEMLEGRGRADELMECETSTTVMGGARKRFSPPFIRRSLLQSATQ